MNSAVYRGRVTHTRHQPVRHAFGYSLFLLALDLDELPLVFRKRWLWSIERPNLMSLRRADYLGDPSLPLDEAVRRRVHDELGFRPDGSIVLVTQLRSLGLAFNPVSFYICHDAAGEPRALVAEITNTPWLERHAYVLDLADAPRRGGLAELRFDKRFHVSPFFDLAQEYVWRIGNLGQRFVVQMENLEGGERVFEAALDLAREPLSGRSLARGLAAHPFNSARVVAAIYWQALRLRLKGAPFFAHPRKRAQASLGETP